VRKVFEDPAISKYFDSLQPGWCAEMYGYIYAAAELGIKHTVKSRLQVRIVCRQCVAYAACGVCSVWRMQCVVM
jgi:hypothetical protein